ncbi:MAG: hypothetical protein L0207_02755 [Chlamydiae bacterium]|nr:hypothetical protein [Chlamydiota bacterium]
MLLRWPQNHIEEEHLNHWISQSIQDESFHKETEKLIDDWKDIWISDEECRNLKLLLEKGEFDLIYRYLDLQISYRKAEDKDILHDSIELEKHLDQYIHYPEKNQFLLEVGTRCIQHTLYCWFKSLNLELPKEFQNLIEADLSKKIQRILQDILKEQSFLLSVKDKFFIEGFLKNLQTNEDSLDYLNRFCSSLEQSMLWEKTLVEILEELWQLSSKDHSKEDKAKLKIQLDYFEKELVNLHKFLGKFLSSSIFPIFSETQEAIAIGKFRYLFQEINNSYGKLKEKILEIPCDEHVCCMCHFSQNISEHWKVNNQVIDILAERADSTLFPEMPCTGQSNKSILIFTCGGGKGHLCTTKAMSQYALGKYHILIANTLEETLASTDFFKKLLFDFSQEKLYNHLLKNEEFEWLKLITAIGPFFIMMQQESIEKLIRLEIFKQNPSLIISCFPVMNAMFLNVAKELTIPFIAVPTDLDTGLFIKGMNSTSCDLNYPLYRMTLAYENPEMRAIIERTIPKDKIHISGFPVRPSFRVNVTPEMKQNIRKKFQVQADEKIIMVMMGGNAGLATQKYAEIFAAYSDSEIESITDQELHIICLCGDQKFPENQRMLSHINGLQIQSKKIKISGIPATESIAEIMTISDILITKPGGCSTNEALAKRLPMIFHSPFALMDWEVFNMEFCIKANMGAKFKMASHRNFFQDPMVKNKQRLLPLIKQAFRRKEELQNDVHHFQSKDFKKEFFHLVESLLFLQNNL